MRINSRKAWVVARCIGTATALAYTSCAAAETPAGTAIVNIARLTVADRESAILSNENIIIVAERLDVTLAAGPVAAVGDGGTIVAATLVNRGNGSEAFAVVATASAPGARIERIAVDGDGDGRYDPARDPDLVGARTPVLAPGAAVTVFVAISGAASGTVTIDTRATTGSGEPGTAFPGAGDEGGDAVTGPTGARASVTVALTPTDATAPTLVKSATLTAPDGSARALRGSTITYTLVARFPAPTAAPRIADAVPAGTAYLPASLMLDNAPLSDAADADAGTATPAAVSVALPDQPAGAVRTVRFKVVIQ